MTVVGTVTAAYEGAWIVIEEPRVVGEITGGEEVFVKLIGKVVF